MKHVSIDRILKRYCLTVIFLAGSLLLQSCTSGIDPAQQIRSGWSVAVGKENDSISDIAGYAFMPVANLYKLERFVPNNYGIIWLQNTFTVPEQLAGHDLTMIIDYINPNDEIYVNGNFIGSTGTISDRHGTNFSDWNTVRKYDIHDGFINSGTNTILVRIFANYEADFKGKILIGTGEPMHRYFIITDFLRTWLNMLIAGIVLFISLNYLFIYVKRPKTPIISTIHYSVFLLLSISQIFL